MRAYDSSYRYNYTRDDFFRYFQQKAFRNGERELFYKYNESLPRYRFYFCFSGGYVGQVYPHRDEPTWSVNFKRGILSTFQARFCPTKGYYTYSEVRRLAFGLTATQKELSSQMTTSNGEIDQSQIAF